MDWLWQALASQAVWEILGVIGLGALLTFLKQKWPTYANSALYGLAAMACGMVIVFTLTGRAILSKRAPETTPDNVEANIKTWCDEFRFGVQKVDDPGDIFTLAITLESGQKFRISRPRNRDRFLILSSTLAMTEPLKTRFNAAPPDKRNEFIAQVTIDGARAGMNVTNNLPDFVQVGTGIPINSDLNEYELWRTADTVVGTITVINNDMYINARTLGLL